jgi:tetratricopeptide (TPR) repeat protein
MNWQHQEIERLLKQGPPDKALVLAEKELKSDPSNAYLHYLIGLASREVHGLATSIAWLRRAAKLGSDGECWRILGHFLAEAGMAVEAEDALKRAFISLEHDLATGLALAQLYRQTNRNNQALELYRQLLPLNAESAELNLNMATLLHRLRRTDEAERFYKKALALDNHNPNTQWEYAMQCLLRGDFKQGWQYYDTRVEHFPARASIHQFPQPIWKGESLKNKTIFVHGEQGFGDQIMFASLLNEIIEQAKKVIIAVHPSLVELFQASFSKATIEPLAATPQDSPSPALMKRYAKVDFQSPIGSLPRWSHNDLLAFKPTAYLKPPEKYSSAAKAWLTDQFAQNKTNSTSMKIGLVWQGNLATGEMGKLKSINLAQLAPLAVIPKCQFVSLQNDDAEQQTKLASSLNVLPTRSFINDFADTAAIIEQLDLVITIDSAVAHLAAAMGKPTWVLLWFSADWRYLEKADSCYWYQNMRLFRQQDAGNWNPVIEQVKKALAQHVKSDA